jgi:hypothetical protein
MIIMRQGRFNLGSMTFSIMTLSIKYSEENFEEKAKNDESPLKILINSEHSTHRAFLNRLRTKIVQGGLHNSSYDNLMIIIRQGLFN